jgi:hypothetical protein
MLPDIFYSFLYIDYITTLRNEQCTKQKVRITIKQKTEKLNWYPKLVQTAEKHKNAIMPCFRYLFFKHYYSSR